MQSSAPDVLSLELELGVLKQGFANSLRRDR